MDTVTHALTGALIGSALKHRTGRAGLACALAASLAPDMDMPLRLSGAEVFLEYHRVVLNSLFVVPFVALAVAALTLRFGSYKRFWPLMGIASATLALHVFMDLTNSYGAKPFWPLSDKWYSLDWVFILDPWITGTLVAGLVAMRFSGRRAAVAAICLALLFGYWGGRAYLHSEALASFKRNYPDASRVGAFPAPVNPFRWRMVAETKPAFWAGWYNLLTGEWDAVEMFHRMPPDALTAKARRDKVARVFLRFARFPWFSYERTSTGWVLKIQDLRFGFSGGGGSGFVTTLPISPQNELGPGEFSFR